MPFDSRKEINIVYKVYGVSPFLFGSGYVYEILNN